MSSYCNHYTNLYFIYIINGLTINVSKQERDLVKLTDTRTPVISLLASAIFVSFLKVLYIHPIIIKGKL
jgi:hypothetical protein